MVSCPPAEWFRKFQPFAGINGQFGPTTNLHLGYNGVLSNYYATVLQSVDVQAHSAAPLDPTLVRSLTPHHTNGAVLTPYRAVLYTSPGGDVSYLTNVTTNCYTYFGTDKGNFTNSGTVTGVPLGAFWHLGMDTNLLVCSLTPIFYPSKKFFNQMQYVIANGTRMFQVIFTNSLNTPFYWCTSDYQFSVSTPSAWPAPIISHDSAWNPASFGQQYQYTAPSLFNVVAGQSSDLYGKTNLCVWSSPFPTNFTDYAGNQAGFSVLLTNGFPYIKSSPIRTNIGTSGTITLTNFSFIQYYPEPTDLDFKAYLWYGTNTDTPTLVMPRVPLFISTFETNIP